MESGNMGGHSMIESLRRMNPHLKIHGVRDGAFAPYGRVIEDHDFSAWLEYVRTNAKAEDGVHYERRIPALEAQAPKEQIERELYGAMPIQIGWCIGRSKRMNGLEYHKGSEVLVAATDLALILGKVWEMTGSRYDSARAAAVYVPNGTALEIYATTLHLAPLSLHDEGFKALIVLPFGTNAPLEREEDRIGLLYARNKWLLAHEDGPLIARGAYPGIDGDNIELES